MTAVRLVVVLWSLVAVSALVACMTTRVPAAPAVAWPGPTTAAEPRPSGGGLGEIVPSWATPAVLNAIDRARSADAMVASLAGQLANAKDEAVTAHAEADTAKREARLAPVRALLLWATWAAAGVGLIGVGLAVFMQRPGALWISAAATAVGIAAQVLGWALDHAVLIGSAVAMLGAIGAVVAYFAYRGKSKGLEAAVRVAEGLKPVLESEAASVVRKAAQSAIVARVGTVAHREIERVRVKLGLSNQAA